MSTIDPILTDPNTHYEQLIGALQTMSINPAAPKETQSYCYNLYSFVIEIVGSILVRRHTSPMYVRAAIPCYRGLSALADAHRPLWIFSLNHDVCLEMLGSELGISVSVGFPEAPLDLPCWNSQGQSTEQRVAFDRLRRDDLKNRAMNFFEDGKRGINLLKIHGSIDIFGVQDGDGDGAANPDRLDYVRLRPVSNSIEGWVEALRRTNEDLAPVEQGHRMLTTGEIGFQEDSDKIGFLRRTILTGEYKFKQRVASNTPPELFDLFRRSLDQIDALFVVGCSMGDAHINEAIGSWLGGNVRRRLTIVDPRPRIPEVLAARLAQIDTRALRGTSFLNEVSGNTLSPSERAIQRVRSITRSLPPECQERIKNFFRSLLPGPR
jgi:hypothetical protein